jgi:hypothetical protein
VSPENFNVKNETRRNLILKFVSQEENW